jgi:perosamine synthetase
MSVPSQSDEAVAVAKRHIPVSQPMLDSREAYFVNDALAKGAISGFFGEYIGLFEDEFARYSDCAYGVANSNGTTALHLGLLAVGVRAGDEVLVSTFTNMATIFAILYIGATPVPVDIEPDTLNMDPALLESLVTENTRAVLVVHLFGHPVDMDPVLDVARKHRLYVIEDCAEAHGALYKGRKVGGLGDAGCFSFYANKIITTGEGGMVTFKNKAFADRARNLKGLAFGDTNKFMHKDVGYNYRMTNLQAAIGHAQFQKIDEIIERKRALARNYDTQFRSLVGVQLPVEKPYARSVYWMYHVVLTGPNRGRRSEVMRRLAQVGVETRETFVPANLQEIFVTEGWTSRDACPKANAVSEDGFYLPSGPQLTPDELAYVGEQFVRILENPA